MTKLFAWNIYFLAEAVQAEKEHQTTYFYICAIASKCNCETLIAVWKQFDCYWREKKQAHDTQQTDSRGHQCPALEKKLTFFSYVNCTINLCLFLPT